jgi:uncharacterized protein (DUF1684 family)
MKYALIISFLSILLFTGCEQKSKASSEYLEEIKQWDQKRSTRLKAEDGWLNLVGRSWLKPGENKFGSAKENDVVIESDKVPEYIGVFILQDSIVTMKVNDGIEVLYKGNPVKEMVLVGDENKDMTVFEYSTVRWNLIIRNEQYGIRFRDTESDLVKNFSGIERFVVDSNWIVSAKFETYNPPKIISVPNVLGHVDEEPSPGAVVFTRDNQSHRVDVIDAGERVWLIFADETSGEETYGGGRFLYADKADSTGNIKIDFNKAYNPPCVFTKFATCPLPPKQNYLKVKITAGEKMWGELH